MELYNILIVEDDLEISELFKLALESPEYALSTALNGTEALEKLEFEKPDLVVLDILIPEPNGWKLYEMIRKAPQFLEYQRTHRHGPHYLPGSPRRKKTPAHRPVYE